MCRSSNVRERRGDDSSGVCGVRSMGVGVYVCGCPGRWARGTCFLL